MSKRFPIIMWSCLSIVVCIIIMASQVLFSSSEKAGSSGAAFVKIVPSARGVALGEAYCGIAENVEAISYNPAGLAKSDKIEILTNYNVYFQDVSYGHVALGIPVANVGSIGLAVSYLGVFGMERRSAAGEEEPQGTFGATGIVGTLSYARGVMDKLLLGLSLKLISYAIEESNASSFAADLGALYKISDSLSIGLSAQNLGTPVKFYVQEDKLPWQVKLGLGYKPINSCILGLDVNVPRDNNINFGIGGEYVISAGESISIPLRIGYSTGLISSLGALAGLRAGLGVEYKKLVALNFTFQPAGEQLGNVFRIAILLKL
mgnify:CR=1 FL=1